MQPANPPSNVSVVSISWGTCGAVVELYRGGPWSYSRLAIGRLKGRTRIRAYLTDAKKYEVGCEWYMSRFI